MMENVSINFSILLEHDIKNTIFTSSHFCQDESVTGHPYGAPTKGLILVAIDCSRKKSSTIKVVSR